MKLLKPCNRDLARPLSTERFDLKPMGYFEALRVTGTWRKDPEILFALFQSSKPRSLRKWLRSNMLPNNRDKFAFAITPHGESEPIGVEMVTLSGYRSAYNTIAIHDREWRGKGVMLEVRAKLINHFFANGIERFYGNVEGRNAASIFNYNRLGFKHVGTMHRHKQDPVTGEVIDLVSFELFREDWDDGPWSEKRRRS